jgi:hypothetical protein
MIKNIVKIIIITYSLLILTACGGNTQLSYAFQGGTCPSGVTQAPYCMQVQVFNNAGGGQTWITNSSYAVSGLSFFTTGAANVQTPSTNKSTMDPNNCTGTTLAPGANCTFYLKIGFESYPTTSSEALNVTINYNLNNTLFGNSSSQGSSTFTIYEVTNLYAAQSNGWAGIFNVNGSTNFYAESYNDPINTAATDTNTYGFLFLGGNVGIYPVGAESGSESSSPSISPGTFNGAISNLFTFSGNLNATPSTSNSSTVWQYTLSSQTWGTSAAFNLATPLRPNANAISPSGVIYLAGSNQVYLCPTSSGSGSAANCLQDGIPTSTPGGPGTINALAFPNSGSAPFTGFYIGGSNGLFAESGTTSTTTTPSNASNTWIMVIESGQQIQNPITAMTSYNNNLYAADNQGNIWYVSSTYPSGGSAPIASLVANVGKPITAITADTIGGILYFAATTSSNVSTLYGCNVSSTPNSCTPQPSNTTLFPVVNLSIASQLVANL